MVIAVTRALKMCDVFSFQRHQAGSPVPAQATYLYRHTRMCACTHAHTHAHSCMHSSYLCRLSHFFLSFKQHVSCLFAPVLFWSSVSISLFIPSSVISPLFLNLGITGLDIEVRILLCFSRLLTLCTRFRNPRRLATREPSVRTEWMGALAR